jgi:hypothetical protein
MVSALRSARNFHLKQGKKLDDAGQNPAILGSLTSAVSYENVHFVVQN